MQHWADYLIFAIFMCILLGIGVYFAFSGGKQKTTSEFIMANRNLKVLPTMMSLTVSFVSAITVIGVPAEVYKYGTLKSLMWCMHLAVMTPLFAQLMVPLFYPLKLTSVYEYFNMRYPDCRGVCIFAIMLGILKNLAYMGTCVYAPAIALEAASGWPLSWNIVLMTAICTIYSALGGMKAVIWTDVFQTIIMLVGIIAVTVKAWMSVGSFERAVGLLKEQGRISLYSFDPDPRTRITFWNTLTGGVLEALVMYLTQASVQRFSAVKSLSAAKLTVLTLLPLKLVFIGLATISGMLVFAHFAEAQCDPILSGEITKSNQIISYFVKLVFSDHPGFSGLFMATLASGALSSVSSGLAGCAAIVYSHFINPNWPNMSELMATTISKLSLVLFGMLTMGIAFGVANMPGPILQVTTTFLLVSGGPVVAMFLLGATRIFRKAKGLDVLMGAVIGFGFNLWIIIGALQLKGKWPPLPPIPSDQCFPPINVTAIPAAEPLVVYGIKNIHTISFNWYSVTGMLPTIFVAMSIAFIANCIGKRKHVPIPEKLFINFRNVYKINPLVIETQDGEEKAALSMETKL